MKNDNGRGGKGALPLDDPNAGPQQFDRSLARLHRKIRREPEPFGEVFQERLLQTMLLCPAFSDAMRNVGRANR